MNILLATGIYPPDIGGPATYVVGLSDALKKKGHQVKVVTYGDVVSGQWSVGSDDVVRVSKIGGIISRWRRYAKALKEHGKDVDAVIVFTSVSAGIPLMLSGLRKPKKILRLGGDFFWERYTDAGGMKGLAAWYSSRIGFWRLLNTMFMEAILRAFDAIVYSTNFQAEIHAKEFRHLPSIVIPNARPQKSAEPHAAAHTPFRVLFMGRFVRFKNIASLVRAMIDIPHATLTLVGDGPIKNELIRLVQSLNLQGRVQFSVPLLGLAKAKAFVEHDLLVLPSITEISPNVALEASAANLPVLLTEQTGIESCSLISIRPLREPGQITTAVKELIENSKPTTCNREPRSYDDIAADFLRVLA